MQASQIRRIHANTATWTSNIKHCTSKSDEKAFSFRGQNVPDQGCCSSAPEPRWGSAPRRYRLVLPRSQYAIPLSNMLSTPPVLLYRMSTYLLNEYLISFEWSAEIRMNTVTH